jgi:hypothetical protein
MRQKHESLCQTKTSEQSIEAIQNHFDELMSENADGYVVEVLAHALSVCEPDSVIEALSSIFRFPVRAVGRTALHHAKLREIEGTQGDLTGI